MHINKEPEDWANYQFILNLFQGDKRQKAEAYRKMVRQYSSEEKKTLEDLKCGLVFGSFSYLNEIRSKFLPKGIHPEKSEQRYLMKTLDIYNLIDQAAGILNFDWKQIKNQVRLTGQDKILSDMLMLLLWEQNAFKNEKIGNAMGISYSGVSKSVSAIKKQIQKDNRLKKSTNRFIHHSRCDPSDLIKNTNDMGGGIRHAALEVTDVQAVFDYLKDQPGVTMVRYLDKKTKDEQIGPPLMLDPFPMAFFFTGVIPTGSSGKWREAGNAVI